jgi:hypothetical protein
MANFTTPNLAGTNAQFNSVLSTFDSIKSQVVAGLELDASIIVATLTTSVVGNLASQLVDLVPELPELPNLNLQSEMSSLINIDQNTIVGQNAFAAKKAALEFQFGEGLTAGGYDLDTLTTNATAAKIAALTVATDIAFATTAFSDARGEVTSSLDTALDASLKLDRSNITNPTTLINDLSTSTTSAISALSSQASSFQSLTDARGAGIRIQDVVPNFEVLAAGGVAFEKASAVLQPTVDTVVEEVSTVVSNPKLAEAQVELGKTLEQFERDTPKVLPSVNAGAFAVTNKAKKITITHIPEESTVNSSVNETKEFKQDGATVTSTVTTSKDSVTTVTTSGGGETILRSNVSPHGFSRRPTYTEEDITPSSITTETKTWTDSNGNSGTVEIDVITLSNKPVEVLDVQGQLPSPNNRFGRSKYLHQTFSIRDDFLNRYKADSYFVDENGRILIGWSDSNGAPPLPDGTFSNGIWILRHKYVPSKTSSLGHIYSVSYNYNDNYDPTFDGNEETVKEKGSPKQDLKKDLDLAQLKKLIAEDKGNTSSIVEVISVVNFSGQKKGLYKHVNGKEYTVLGATVKGLYNTMTFHSQDQPLFFSEFDNEFGEDEF